MLKLRLLVCVIPALGRNDSLGHDLHEEGSGDLRVEGHLGGEIAGGLDGLDLDGLRVHRSLVGQSDGDGLVGDTTEQLGRDSDTLAAISTVVPSMAALAATASSRVATALARRARFIATI